MNELARRYTNLIHSDMGSVHAHITHDCNPNGAIAGSFILGLHETQDIGKQKETENIQFLTQLLLNDAPVIVLNKQEATPIPSSLCYAPNDATNIKILDQNPRENP
ncbi:phosphoglucosamine mutase [Acrasis kona]|uniref:Phosphoglucosamine mutase n=1 Tax=Acrasis kona TaxID=1008807 RepID=A0AAW2YPS0_9EUKA